MLNLNLSVEVLKAILNSYKLSKDTTTAKTFDKAFNEACNSFNISREQMYNLIMEVK